MKNFFTKSVLSSTIILCCFIHTTWAQTTSISGIVKDESNKETLAGVNIVVKEKVIGTITNGNGEFSFTVNSAPPFTIVASFIGFTAQEIEITDANTSGLEIRLAEQFLLGQEVVVSASRVEENILKSPVSIEKMDIRAIQENASPSFYDALQGMKGVDVSTQSLTFKSVNTRGFGANGNERFVQLIDAIDNQAPGLNFPVGNLVGLSELDLESIELVPGAASALYGPNALNGILLMNSKSPFEYQGLSVYTKFGFNHTDNRDDDMSPYHNYGLRYAKSFNNKFAFKVVANWLKACDFRGVDYRDKRDIVERSAEIDPTIDGYRGGANEQAMRTYDGVNVYGDGLLNVASTLRSAAPDTYAAIAGLLPLGSEGDFSTTGYAESDFVDNKTESLKIGVGLNYRLNDQLELSGQFNYGSGSTVYTGNDRYILDGLSIWTGKLELKGSNFFVRAYTTQEDSGDTYAANALASLINKESTIPAYLNTFAGARTAGASIDASHAAARVASDALRASNLADGTYQEAFNRLKGLPISQGGAKFLDKSNLWHYEGMYNLSDKIEFMDVIVGANFRRYDLNSEGTLFALDDNGEEFDIDEWGAYSQFSKNLIDDKLSLKAAIRYDKNVNFEGQFSPRVSAVYTLGGTHNIRGSFQRGFRIPTTQDQYIDLDIVTARLVGSNDVLINRYAFNTNPVLLYNTAIDSLITSDGSVITSHDNAEAYEVKAIDTEKVNTFEIGYKSLISNKLLIDAYYYTSTYIDFVSTVRFLQNTTPQANAGDAFTSIASGGATQLYQFDVNSPDKVKAHGYALGLEYALPKGYSISGNAAFNELKNQEELNAKGLQPQYNTPEWRYNIKFSNRKLTDKLGFNLTWRWQDAFLWQSSIGTSVIPAYQTIDAQVSYKLTSIKTILKVGGSNIFNQRYTTSFTNPSLGAVYYISLNFEEFLN